MQLQLSRYLKRNRALRRVSISISITWRKIKKFSKNGCQGSIFALIGINEGKLHRKIMKRPLIKKGNYS
jgi:hypothetical protein